jgi:hypothetical protein
MGRLGLPPQAVAEKWHILEMGVHEAVIYRRDADGATHISFFRLEPVAH